MVVSFRMMNLNLSAPPQRPPPPTPFNPAQPPMRFRNIPSSQQQQQSQPPHQTLERQQQEETNSSASATGRRFWGPSVWYLFHTLAHKIKEQDFPLMKDDFMKFVYRICANLPCPECAEHATTHLRKNSKRSVNTKEELKRFLFDFHNEVNARLKKPIMLWAESNTQYEDATTAAVIQFFFQRYGKKSNGNLKLMTQNFHRDILLSEFSAWVATNNTRFDP